MFRLLRMAWRNVTRNRRRSFLAGLSMAVGTGFILFLSGFANGFIESVIKNTADTTIGAIQIHHAGFLSAESNPLTFDMPSEGALLGRIRETPGVEQVTPRITFEGFVSNGVNSSVFLGTAIAPETEYQVCPNRRAIEVDGSLQPNDMGAALFGDVLAESFDLTVGNQAQQSVTLQSVTQKGNTNADDITFKGSLTFNVPFVGKRVLVVPLRYAQKLLRMPGRATEYAIRVNDLNQVDAVAERLRQAVGSHYEVLTWRQRDLQADKFVGQIRAILLFVIVVLCVLVAASIANTTLLSVYERTREIGTMMAVGVRRLQVLTLFLFESLLLALLASSLGALIGWLVVFWLSGRGVLLKPPGTKPVAIYPFISLKMVAPSPCC